MSVQNTSSIKSHSLQDGENKQIQGQINQTYDNITQLLQLIDKLEQQLNQVYYIKNLYQNGVSETTISNIQLLTKLKEENSKLKSIEIEQLRILQSFQDFIATKKELNITKDLVQFNQNLFKEIEIINAKFDQFLQSIINQKVNLSGNQCETLTQYFEKVAEIQELINNSEQQ